MKNIQISKKRKKYRVTVNDTRILYAYITSLNYLLFISDGYYNGGYRLTYNYEELRIGEKPFKNELWKLSLYPVFAVMQYKKYNTLYTDFRSVLSGKAIKRYGKYFLYGT